MQPDKATFSSQSLPHRSGALRVRHSCVRTFSRFGYRFARSGLILTFGPKAVPPWLSNPAGACRLGFLHFDPRSTMVTVNEPELSEVDPASASPAPRLSRPATFSSSTAYLWLGLYGRSAGVRPAKSRMPLPLMLSCCQA